MVTYRPAVIADGPRVVQMGLTFHASSPYAAVFVVDPGAVSRLVEMLLTHADATILVAERDGELVGMIGLMAYAHLMSGARIASELAWWVDPQARGSSVAVRLLQHAEAWAVAHGATALHMIAPDDRVAKLYERRGFQRVEIAYQKSLKES